jgi:hypothetical protein
MRYVPYRCLNHEYILLSQLNQKHQPQPDSHIYKVIHVLQYNNITESPEGKAGSTVRIKN